MRYYSLVITRADGSLYTFKSIGGAAAAGVTLTSLLPSGPQSPITGLTNPAALNVELDIGIANVTDPDNSQGAYLRIWGLGLQDIGHASDLNNLNISLSAGMAKGLPLANPQQASVIMQGQIQQAFGNWIGTSQTLDMVFYGGGAGVGTQDAPANYPFSVPAGTPLARAIANTLSIALPNLPPTISISPNLILNYDVTGHYPSLATFASFVKALSQGIIGGTDYPGVTISITNGQAINVFDGLGPTPISAVKAIAAADCIGQPTWIGNQTVSVKTVLRADIHVGDTISLPPTIFTQSQAAIQQFNSSPQTGLTFSGNFWVAQVHHYGNSRQPSADAWNTTYQVVPVNS